MKAIKGNKVYTVDGATKKAYLSQGYDIVDDDGKLLEKSPSATVSYSDYTAVKAELDKIKPEYETIKAELDKIEAKK